MNPSRQEAAPHTPCPLYRKCGGCQLQNMDYPRQLHWKQEQVQRLLGRFCKARPIIGMEHPYHYRNKVQAAFAWDKRRNTCLISGATNDGKAIMNIPVRDCFLDHKDGIRACILRYLAREYIKTQLDIPVDLVIQNHGAVRLKPEQCIPEDDDGFIVDGDLAGFFFKDTTEVRTAIQAADNQHKLTYCKPVFLWHQNLFLGFYSLTLDMTFHIRKIDRYAVDISIGIVETLTDKLKEVKRCFYESAVYFTISINERT